MKYFCAILALAYIVCQCDGFEDYRIVDRNGVKTPFYENLYYSIRSKVTGLYVGSGYALKSILDTRDQTEWFRFVKDGKDGYKWFHADGGQWYNVIFDMISGNEVRIVVGSKSDHNYGLYYADGTALQGNEKRINVCSGCAPSENYVKWILSEYPEYHLSADVSNGEFKIPIGANDININFKSRLTFNGTGPSVVGDKRLDANSIRVLLSKDGYEGDLYAVDDYTLRATASCNVRGSNWLTTTLTIDKNVQYSYYHRLTPVKDNSKGIRPMTLTYPKDLLQ